MEGNESADDADAVKRPQGASGLGDDTAEGEEGGWLFDHTVVETSLDPDIERGSDRKWSWESAGAFDAHVDDRRSGLDPDSGYAGGPRRGGSGAHVQFDDVIRSDREVGSEGSGDCWRGARECDWGWERRVATDGDIASGFELLVLLVGIEPGIRCGEQRRRRQGTAEGDGVCVGLKNVLGEAGAVFRGRSISRQSVLSRSESAVGAEDESPAGEDVEGSAHGHGRSSVQGSSSEGTAHEDGYGDFCVSGEVRPANLGLGEGGRIFGCGGVVVKNGEGDLLKDPSLLDLPRSGDAPGDGITPPGRLPFPSAGGGCQHVHVCPVQGVAGDGGNRGAGSRIRRSQSDRERGKGERPGEDGSPGGGRRCEGCDRGGWAPRVGVDGCQPTKLRCEMGAVLEAQRAGLGFGKVADQSLVNALAPGLRHPECSREKDESGKQQRSGHDEGGTLARAAGNRAEGFHLIDAIRPLAVKETLSELGRTASLLRPALAKNSRVKTPSL